MQLQRWADRCNDTMCRTDVPQPEQDACTWLQVQPDRPLQLQTVYREPIAQAWAGPSKLCLRPTFGSPPHVINISDECHNQIGLEFRHAASIKNPARTIEVSQAGTMHA